MVNAVVVCLPAICRGLVYDKKKIYTLSMKWIKNESAIYYNVTNKETK